MSATGNDFAGLVAVVTGATGTALAVDGGFTGLRLPGKK